MAQVFRQQRQLQQAMKASRLPQNRRRKASAATRVRTPTHFCQGQTHDHARTLERHVLVHTPQQYKTASRARPTHRWFSLCMRTTSRSMLTPRPLLRGLTVMPWEPPVSMGARWPPCFRARSLPVGAPGMSGRGPSPSDESPPSSAHPRSTHSRDTAAGGALLAAIDAGQAAI